MSHSDDEEYTIPLQDKRVFGAGIKRKRVPFVAASDTAASTTNTSAQSSGPSASDFYLNLVLPKDESPSAARLSSAPPQTTNEPLNNISDGASRTANDSQAQLVCETCHLPIGTSSSTTAHQALLAHQLSLPHSHPPSSLSRSHPGLRILRSQGWDPDSRLGLGATGGGIRFPIKAKKKGDKMGVGASIPVPEKGDAEVSRAGLEAKVKKAKEDMRGKKGKGWLKKQTEEDRRRGDKLKDLFYGSEDMDKYLKR